MRAAAWLLTLCVVAFTIALISLLLRSGEVSAQSCSCGGSTGKIAKFTGTNSLGNSVITESSTGRIGIGTGNPMEKLDVIGGAFFRGNSARAMFAANQTGTGDIAAFFQGGTSKVVISNEGNVGIGTPTPSVKLEVEGEIRAQGVLKVGTAAPTSYSISTQRYVVEAPPSVVGQVIPLDVGLVDALCRDKDGCLVTLQMVNWDSAGHPGAVASKEERLFLSETSGWWRFTNNDVAGLDGNASLCEWPVFDCVFTDAESYTGTPNGRTDAGPGFGLLNLAGGSYSDTTTTCRIVIQD